MISTSSLNPLAQGWIKQFKSKKDDLYHHIYLYVK